MPTLNPILGFPSIIGGIPGCPLYIEGESPGAPLYIEGESPGTPLYMKPVGCVVVWDVDGAKRIHCSAQKHNLELGNMIIIYCV